MPFVKSILYVIWMAILQTAQGDPAAINRGISSDYAVVEVKIGRAGLNLGSAIRDVYLAGRTQLRIVDKSKKLVFEPTTRIENIRQLQAFKANGGVCTSETQRYASLFAEYSKAQGQFWKKKATREAMIYTFSPPFLPEDAATPDKPEIHFCISVSSKVTWPDMTSHGLLTLRNVTNALTLSVVWSPW